MAYDLTDLKLFVAAAEEGNLSRGAERCHLSASSASLRIKNLESVLGVVLLTRRARGVIPTAAGQILLEHARRCLAQLHQMRADLVPFGKGMTGNVTVFANNNAISTHLPYDLAIFFKKYPNVRVTLEERMSPDIVKSVLEGRSDLGVIALETEHPELRYIPYKKDKLVMIAPLKHMLAKEPAVYFADCLQHPFICMQSGSAIHTFLLGKASALGVNLDVRVQVSGFWANLKLIASGAGIGVVPRTAIPLEEEQNLVIIDLKDQWSKRDLRVCIPRLQEERNINRDQLIDTMCGSGWREDSPRAE